MNTVKNKSTALSQQIFALGDFCFNNYKASVTAFVGTCGNGPKNSLYLITYDSIFLADDPYQSWSSKGCTVFIDEFVDIEITIKEK